MSGAACRTVVTDFRYRTAGRPADQPRRQPLLDCSSPRHRRARVASESRAALRLPRAPPPRDHRRAQNRRHGHAPHPWFEPRRAARSAYLAAAAPSDVMLLSRHLRWRWQSLTSASRHTKLSGLSSPRHRRFGRCRRRRSDRGGRRCAQRPVDCDACRQRQPRPSPHGPRRDVRPWPADGSQREPPRHRSPRRRRRTEWRGRCRRRRPKRAPTAAAAALGQCRPHPGATAREFESLLASHRHG
mmetsp:Transcript_5276/g.15575  ORF Transcript_5276/g.15575 Transcript_5276/m.15575 type:complete len:243 (+) Transcript_5276:1445-2173(+)